MKIPWIYDEFRHIGVDFDNPKEVESYDARQGTRIEDERALVKRLGIKEGDAVVEYGVGTGAFAIAAGEKGAHVVGLDISPSMIEFSKRSARKHNVGTVDFQVGSYLTHSSGEETIDFVVTKFAFHHLPEFWKVSALREIWKSLKPRGILYIQDVVFSFHPDEKEKVLEEWINEAVSSGSFSIGDFEMHIREEYSTYGKLMETILDMSGFRIREANYYSKVQAEYLCSKD